MVTPFIPRTLEPRKTSSSIPTGFAHSALETIRSSTRMPWKSLSNTSTLVPISTRLPIVMDVCSAMALKPLFIQVPSPIETLAVLFLASM